MGATRSCSRPARGSFPLLVTALLAAFPGLLWAQLSVGFGEEPLTLAQLFGWAGPLPNGVLSVVPEGQEIIGPSLPRLPELSVTLTGWGSAAPPRLMAAPFTMITWWQLSPQLQTTGPALTLAPGQELILDSLTLYLADLAGPFGYAARLPTLAPALLVVPAGASLQLKDVVVVLAVLELAAVMKSICAAYDTSAFPYSPGVVMEDGVVRLVDHTSVAPDEYGTDGAGGEVRYINVTLTCPGYGTAALPCAARPITEGWQLGAAVLGPLLNSTEGPVMLSLAPDVALPADGSWEQVVIPAGRVMVLIGDPSLQQQRGRRSTLDLSGLEGAWAFMDGGALSIYTPTVLRAGTAHLRDLQLINLPYSSRPREAVNLLAIGMQSFQFTGRNASGQPLDDGLPPQLRVSRCTLVVSDPELAFLAGAAAASVSGGGQPNLTALFGGARGQPRIGGDPLVDGAEGSLLLDVLQIRSLVRSLVAFTTTTLVSASRYWAGLPPAAAGNDTAVVVNAIPPTTALGPAAMRDLSPLLPSSLLWPPLLVYDRDVALQWGGAGTIVAGALEEALLTVDSCGQAPSGRTVIMLSSTDDQSVPPVASGQQLRLLGPTLTPLAAAESCVVAGYPPALSGRRTFVNMQARGAGEKYGEGGALGRAALSSPITLRDLVLYNLAPGGTYPLPAVSEDGSVEALRPAPQLQGADAPWANSSLPLWYFQFARSAGDLAAPLVLSKVTLVVPEAEWHALAAAMLLQHAPAEMAAAQQPRAAMQPPQRPPPSLRRRRALVEDPAFSGDSAPDPPPPLPPALPAPPPPYSTTTRAALSAFAASSKVASYSYTSGVLVLAEARWYGVYGTDVTVSYRLPEDAPPGAAALLSYPPLVLPYQELVAQPAPAPPPGSDSANASGGEPAGEGGSSTGADATGRGPLGGGAPPPTGPAPRPEASPPADGQLPQQQQQTQPLPSGDALAREGPPGGGSGSTQPVWLVPVVATVSTVGGVAMLAAAVCIVLVLVKRGSTRHGPGRVSKQKLAAAETPQEAGAGGGAARPVVGPQAGTICIRINSSSSGNGGAAKDTTARDEVSSSGAGSAAAGAVDLKGSGSRPGLVPAATRESLAFVVTGGSKGIGGSNTAGSAAATTFTATTSTAATTARAAANHHTLQLALLHAAEAEVEAVAAAAVASDAVGRLSSGREPRPCEQPLEEELQAYFGNLAGMSYVVPEPEPEPEPVEPERQPNLPVGGSTRRQHGGGDGARQMTRAIGVLLAELRDPDLEVHGMLGCGSFGVVYGGVWRGLPVAVKTLVVPGAAAGVGGLLAGLAGSRDARTRQRAVLEAAISLSMSHPNIVATYTYELKPLVQQPAPGPAPDWGPESSGGGGGAAPCVEEADGHKLYIVQELCNGGSLAQALAAGMAGSIIAGGLARRLALRLALDVALGMAHVHGCRVVHGDLKPDNVLISSGARHDDHCADQTVVAAAGGMLPLTLTAKVADFGLSLPLQEGATHASHRFQGTPLYSAPEVIAEGHQSAKADAWSFGLVLFELFYGCTMATIHSVHGRMQYGLRQGGGPASGLLPQARSMEETVMEEMFKSPYLSYAHMTAACLRIDPRGRPTFEELVSILQAMSSGDEGSGL
ncbi:Serine/threonine-protein kinase unc-51 [Tetrabaena socialis]|uniref:Serine/threonine-protein kinase unc-51 n=1 Tax=Tetrabaena socialis TaxID=47790 RepID=A0A2J7ZX43_9CHLO|nr:Serine/threonine-protein kinase unc-51 [Tetrabaena socialis]|eukprot:PNH04828.1 Serine/threonine-protein kinase unc-51 [Tetrabaena socialis]